MIVVRMPESKLVLDAEEAGTRRIVTTVGKLIFNDIFPDDFPYVNSAEPAFGEELTRGDFLPKGMSFWEYEKANADRVRKPATKGFLSKLVGVVRRKYGNAMTADVLDAMKNLGFHYATISGTTVGIEDIAVPDEKQSIIRDADARVEEIEGQYRRGPL